MNTSKFSISNAVDGEFVSLFGAVASGFELPTVTITLTEAQRVKAIEMSGQPGGDGNAQFAKCKPGRGSRRIKESIRRKQQRYP